MARRRKKDAGVAAGMAKGVGSGSRRAEEDEIGDDDDGEMNDDDDDEEEEDDDDDNFDDKNKEEEEEEDTILASVYVAKVVASSRVDGPMSASVAVGASVIGTTTTRIGPSCRCVLFSSGPPVDDISGHRAAGGEGRMLYTACNGGSLRCLDVDVACGPSSSSSDQMHDDLVDSPSSSSILWSIENAHNAGINRLYQLPNTSPCGPLLVTGDDIGTIRLWDVTRICVDGDGDNDSRVQRRRGNKDDNNGGKNGDRKDNAFEHLMKLPKGCVQHWKVNTDYISDITSNDDGTLLFATSGDGTLSVFDLHYVRRAGTSRCVTSLDAKDDDGDVDGGDRTKSWERHGYARSDDMEDELLCVTVMKRSKKVVCGTQDGTLCLFSHGRWGDISDRYPGHPQSIDALLKVDEDTVLTGCSDGLVRAVRILPNALLGILGNHDGFPVEMLKFGSGRRMVGSVSHDEYVRLWDASLLNDEDEDDGDDDDDGIDDGMRDESAKATAKGTARTGRTGGANDEDGDDGWEDMDEGDEGDEGGTGDDDDDDLDDDDDSDDSDDSGGGGGGGKPKKGERIFKTENESFFSDL
jgi:WD40 repeat protein